MFQLIDTWEIDPHSYTLDIISLVENSKGFEFTMEYNSQKLVFRVSLIFFKSYIGEIVCQHFYTPCGVVFEEAWHTPR